MKFLEKINKRIEEDNYLMFNADIYDDFVFKYLNNDSFIEELLGNEYNADALCQEILDYFSGSKIIDGFKLQNCIDNINNIKLNKDKENELENLKYSISFIDKDNSISLNDKKNKYNEILNNLDNGKYNIAYDVRNKLINDIVTSLSNIDRVIRYSMSNEDYVARIRNDFNGTNNVWLSRYGCYTNNLVFGGDRRYNRSNPVFLCETPYLNNNYLKTNRIFTPLCINNLIYVPEKLNSISTFSIRGNIKKISEVELPSNIIFSGAIGFSNDMFLVFICCEKQICIIDKDNSVSTINYPVKNINSINIRSITTFNQYCYILLEINDTLYIQRIKYDYKYRNERIVVVYDSHSLKLDEINAIGELFIYYRNDLTLGLFINYNSNQFLKTFDENLNEQRTIQVSHVPYEGNSNGKCYFTSASIDEDYLYYLSIDRNKRLYIVRLDLNTYEFKVVNVTSDYSGYVLVAKKGSDKPLPHFTNLLVKYDKVIFSNFYMNQLYLSVDMLQEETRNVLSIRPLGNMDTSGLKIFPNVIIDDGDATRLIDSDIKDDYRIISMINYKPIVVSGERGKNTDDTKCKLHILLD